MKRSVIFMMVIGVIFSSQIALAFDKQDWLGEWKLEESQKKFVIDEFDDELIISGEGSEMGWHEISHLVYETFDLSNSNWKKEFSKDYSKLKIDAGEKSILCVMQSSGNSVECSYKKWKFYWLKVK